MKPRKLSIVASKVSEAGHRKGNGGREEGEGMELMLLLMNGYVRMYVHIHVSTSVYMYDSSSFLLCSLLSLIVGHYGCDCILLGTIGVLSCTYM